MPIVSSTTNPHILRNRKTYRRRLRRICSDVEDFTTKAEEISSFFEQSNYPERITKAALEKVKDLSQDDALLPSDNASSNNRIPLVLTYHPLNKKVKDLIYRKLQHPHH